MATIRKGRGHPEVFTEQQNAELRGALAELKSKRNYSQTAVGEILGVGQQAAGRLLKSDAAGFSYATATRLVRFLGYAGVDTFFRAKGVALPSEPPQARSA